LKRHLVFFNTTPHIVTLLLGITTAMEEKNSQQKNMDANAIDNVKASLMGPLAGLGTPFLGDAAPDRHRYRHQPGAEGQHSRADPVSAGV
jgi:mannose/fructose/N-acetylgalactosamine-specific phosphotransferase system component IID